MDIARSAGVHNTTVSLALRNCRSIPEATRKRIQAIAEQLGYAPDPALRALVAYRRGLAAHNRSEAIAYITNCRTKWGWREIPFDERYFVGAQRRAEACGYQLEHFWLGEPGMTGRRLSHMLFHRGITGILIGSQETGVSELPDFDWERISAVQIGGLPIEPVLTRVTSHPEGALRLAIRRASAAGYRRIGLVLPDAWDRATERTWSSSFAAEQSRLSTSPQIPVLLQGAVNPGEKSHAGASPEVARLANWLSEFRPDVVLGSWAQTSAMWSSLGLRVPQDLAFIELLHDGNDATLAGVRLNDERAGEVAAEILIHQLQQNFRGRPDAPTTTLVESVWCDGASMPTPLNRWGSNTAPVKNATAQSAQQTAA